MSIRTSISLTDINQLLRLGYTSHELSIALQRCQNPSFGDLLSYLSNSRKSNNFSSTTSPKEKLKLSDKPVGLKNTGNTCYVNSLLQAYFNIPKLSNEILKIAPRANIWSVLKPVYDVEGDQFLDVSTIHELQDLFANLALSNRKYYDPTRLIKELNSRGLETGLHQDVGEFNSFLLDRIDEGIKSLKKIPGSESSEPISNLFMGKLSQKLKYRREEESQKEEEEIEKEESQKVEEEIVKESQEDFSIVLLEILFADIYGALDVFTNSSSITYEHHEGEIDIKFLKLPSILVFQLQRVLFNSTLQMGVKQNQGFKFDKTIYLDRYMRQNEEIVIEKEKQIKNVKTKISKLRNKLEKYLNWEKSGSSLSISLTNCINWCTDSTIKEYLLEGLKKHQEEIIKINLEIEKSKMEITEMFSDLRTKQYNLHAIFIHLGSASFGHYYCLVKKSNTEWYKYDDEHVSIVKDEDVFSQNQINQGVSYLIYTSSELDDLNEKILVPQDLEDLINLENDKLINEIQNFELKIKEELENKQKMELKSESLHKIKQLKYHPGETWLKCLKSPEMFAISFNKNEVALSLLTNIETSETRKIKLMYNLHLLHKEYLCLAIEFALNDELFNSINILRYLNNLIENLIYKAPIKKPFLEVSRILLMFIFKMDPFEFKNLILNASFAAIEILKYIDASPIHKLILGHDPTISSIILKLTNTQKIHNCNDFQNILDILEKRIKPPPFQDFDIEFNNRDIQFLLTRFKQKYNEYSTLERNLY